jgi:hypothetical protein
MTHCPSCMLARSWQTGRRKNQGTSSSSLACTRHRRSTACRRITSFSCYVYIYIHTYIHTYILFITFICTYIHIIYHLYLSHVPGAALTRRPGCRSRCSARAAPCPIGQDRMALRVLQGFGFEPATKSRWVLRKPTIRQRDRRTLSQNNLQKLHVYSVSINYLPTIPRLAFKSAQLIGIEIRHLDIDLQTRKQSEVRGLAAQFLKVVLNVHGNVLTLR